MCVKLGSKHKKRKRGAKYLIPKWPRFKYSFVFIQIRPWCLVQDKIFFWILSLRTRHQGLIWIKTKEYLNGGHFGIRCIWRSGQPLRETLMRRTSLLRSRSGRSHATLGKGSVAWLRPERLRRRLEENAFDLTWSLQFTSHHPHY